VVSVTEQPEMKIKALAGWAGGKRTLASRIVEELGPHRAYWGLCCGSLAVEFAKPPCSMETVVDLHGDVTNLAFVLQEDDLAVRLFEKLNRTLLSRELYLKSAEVIKSNPAPQGDDPPDWERAYHYMLMAWFGRGGVAGTSNYKMGFCMRYTSKGGHAAQRFVSAVNSIPAWCERLRTMTIMRCDIFDVLEPTGRKSGIEDAKGTVIYIDPPYVTKGFRYLHDFADSDHQRLATALNRYRKTRVVVSYYDCPEVREMYAGWTFVRLKANKGLANQGQRDKGGAIEAPEVLIINGESLTQPPEVGGLFATAP